MGFLNQLNQTIPSRREVHLILDNYATHTHPKVEAWFVAHPRYHRHFVPTSASWLTLIERWFAEITRKRIRRGTFRSVADLIRAIEDYVTHHNRHSVGFRSAPDSSSDLSSFSGETSFNSRLCSCLD